MIGKEGFLGGLIWRWLWFCSSLCTASELLPQPLTVFLELLIILKNSSLIDEPLFLRGDADRGSNVLLKFLYIHLQEETEVSGNGGKGRTEEGQLTWRGEG